MCSNDEDSLCISAEGSDSSLSTILLQWTDRGNSYMVKWAFDCKKKKTEERLETSD